MSSHLLVPCLQFYFLNDVRLMDLFVHVTDKSRKPVSCDREGGKLIGDFRRPWGSSRLHARLVNLRGRELPPKRESSWSCFHHGSGGTAASSSVAYRSLHVEVSAIDWVPCVRLLRTAADTVARGSVRTLVERNHSWGLPCILYETFCNFLQDTVTFHYRDHVDQEIFGELEKNVKM